MSSRSVLVIGVGNQLRGDDAAGLEVARRLGGVPATVAVRVYEGEAIGLLELWHGVDAVVLIDTVRSGSPAGTIHRFDAGATALPAVLGRSSSHTIGVAEAIELARTLGTLPPEVVVYGVEGAVFDAGADLSGAVAGALDGLAEAVRREARSLAEASELPPQVTIFGPDPLLSVTIEAVGAADDIHLHAAGQGVWVARMAGEMGAWPVLCCFLGGETGTTLSTLLMALPGERRVVTTAGPSGSYVIDRRGGERQLLATALRTPPHRHELDDLVAATCAAGVGSAALIVCNPYPPEGLPHEAYETIVADVRAAGVPVVADLSSPLLDRILPFGPEIVKLNDWELAGYVSGPVDGPLALDAMRRLRAAGAQTVAVTRAGESILVLSGEDEPFEVVPPKFPHGFREGNGDAMTGALAAALARGLPLHGALVLGAAAGSGNFLRHGLGTGRRAAVEELAARVLTRPLQSADAATAGPTPPRTGA
jgi:1-phosphofructokinase